MKIKKTDLYLWLIIFALIGIDQLSKFCARSKLEPYHPVEVIPGFFNLTLVFNEGAAWGIFEGFRYGFIVLAILMVLFIAWKRSALFGESLLGKIVTVLLVGGIIGNAIDRFVSGKVTDFIDLWFGNYNFPCFNIADSFICIGVALYFILTFKTAASDAKLKVKS